MLHAGFFKAHRDTPASTDMFGSLILCLPTEFTGRQLVIKSPNLNTTVTHDWGSTSSTRVGGAGASAGSSNSSNSHGAIAWAAMYSDCEHEIKPVTTGHRVTLTYNLFQDPASSSSSPGGGRSAAAAPEGAASTAHESPFGTELAAALADATWYPKGVTLGLVLEHFYAVKPLSECREDYYGGFDSNMPTNIRARSLKGLDLQLYQAAHALGLEVTIVPVVSLEEFEHKQLQGDVRPSAPLSPSKLAVLKSFDADPTEEHGWDPDDEWGDGEGEWGEFLKSSIAANAAGAEIAGDLLWIKPPAKQHLKYCGAVGMWLGNEGGVTCWYAAASLLVVVPAVGAPGRRRRG